MASLGDGYGFTRTFFPLVLAARANAVNPAISRNSGANSRLIASMSSPSRSGTTHLTVETILQGEGWNKGWQQLLMIAGNCAAITERSFGVPDGINNGQFGAGPVIDFFGLAGKYSGFPVDFVYPAMTSIVPANIALIAGGKNTADASTGVVKSL